MPEVSHRWVKKPVLESGKGELTVLGELLQARMRLLMKPLLELIENG